MKKKNFYLLALSAWMLSACSNEMDPFGESPDGGAQQQQITFVFPGTAQGVVPYAAATATTEENEIATLDAYVFGADPLATANPAYLLENVFKLKEGEGLTTAGQDRTAVVKLTGTNPKVIYFVANGRTQPTLDDYELGKTDTTTFVMKQTQHMGKGLVKCPLLMTGRYTAPVKDGILEMPADNKAEVLLTRRVARFDIMNNSEETTFTIEKIQIKNARPGAFIFPFAAAQVYTEALVPDLMEIDFNSFLNANVSETSSVFYLYPTVDDGETYFELKGLSQSGSPMVQPVKMRKKQTGTAEETKLLPVKANTRYLINILATGSADVNAAITVKEWQVGEKAEVDAGYGIVKLDLMAPIADVTLTESKLLTVPATASAEAFEIKVTADTEWKLVHDPKLSWITTSGLPDAGTKEVGKSFKIAISANPGSAEREGILYIQNVARPDIVQALTVKQAGNTAGFQIEGDKLVNNTLQFFGAESQSALTITAPDAATVAFEVPVADTWLTVQETAFTRATSTKTLYVKAAANTTNAERTSTITISIGEGEAKLTQTIEVVQAPRNLGSIAVKAEGLDNNMMTYQTAGKTGARLLVRALTEWKVTAFELDDAGAVTATTADWITNGTIKLSDPAESRASYDGEYTFDVTANDGAERKCKLTLVNTVNEQIKYEITVTQKEKVAAPTFTVSGDHLSGNSIALTKDALSATTYTVAPSNSNNAGLTIEKSTADWLTLTSTDLIAGGTFTLEATENTDAAERTATITITLAGADAPTVITVTQAGTPAPAPVISIAEGTNTNISTYNFAVDATTAVSFTATATQGVSTGFTATLSDESWLTIDVTSIDSGTFTLTPKGANDGVERTATITIRLAGATDKVITVTQTGV